jgi:hypothetical protein
MKALCAEKYVFVNYSPFEAILGFITLSAIVSASGAMSGFIPAGRVVIWSPADCHCLMERRAQRAKTRTTGSNYGRYAPGGTLETE